MRQTVDSVLNIGPKVKDLVELIRRGCHEQALLRLLVIPNRWASRLLAMSDTVPPRARKWTEGLADLFWSRQQQKQRDFLTCGRDKTTALEMIRFFYESSMRSEVYHYFCCRFGQPRHLAALSLASLFPESEKPVLDLACGFGHLTHYWLNSRRNQSIIGVDRNFFQLYVAKNWLAPGGEFICAEADLRLPFVSQGLSGVFCSDAFHCFLRRAVCADEMKRITDASGLIVLARMGNRHVEPREGYELSAERYSDLFRGLLTRIVSEEDLLDSYLKRMEPQLQAMPQANSLERNKWLSLVASGDPGKLRNYGQFEQWPHAAGRLSLNPLYHKHIGNDSAEVSLSLRFPSKWYEFENSGCLRYMPQSLVVPKRVLDELKNSTSSKEIESLVEKCVLVGMPARYSSASE